MYLQIGNQIIITLLTLVLCQGLSYIVSAARYKYKIIAPATTGDSNFERRYRAHLNQLENTIIFLPLIWMAGVGFSNNFIFQALAYSWIIARVIYSYSYILGKKNNIMLISGIVASICVVILGFLSLSSALSNFENVGQSNYWYSR